MQAYGSESVMRSSVLDVFGLFWLTGQPDDKIPGHLRYDEAKGPVLELAGSFHKLPAAGTVHFANLLDDAPVRILGVAGRRRFTLDGCLGTRLTLLGQSIRDSDEYRPHIIFEGAHFDAAAVPRFSGFQSKINHLITWIGKSGIRVVDADDRSRKSRDLTVRVVPIQNELARTTLGELEISYRYRRCGDGIAQTAIKQNCRLELRFGESKPLEDALKACVALQQLVTIGVDAPVSIATVSLLPDPLISTAGHEGTDSTIKLYAELPGSGLAKASTTIQASTMLFTYDDIGGINGLAAWLSTANELGPVVGLLTSHWYMPEMYVENRFFNAITAAETLHRIREPKSKDNLKLSEKLKHIASRAGVPFAKLVGDVEAWAKLVADARNKRIVHRGLSESGDIDELHWLGESVYVLLVFWLLRQCDVPEISLESIMNRRKCVSIRNRVLPLTRQLPLEKV